jgi:adenylylsulfate kinase
MDRTYGWTIWLTGLPMSGKTTLARVLRRTLNESGIPVVLLDSEEVWREIMPSAACSSEERDRFYSRLVELAAWLADSGENVIIAATASRRCYREAARARLAPRFAEIWVRCPPAVCRARAASGDSVQAALSGDGAGYEPPIAPDVVVDSDRQRPEEAAEAVIDSLPFVQPEAAVCA